MIDSETLSKAADLIEKAEAKLDTTGEPCESCGHVHYGAWNEKQMSEELKSTVRKLRKFATRPKVKPR